MSKQIHARIGAMTSPTTARSIYLHLDGDVENVGPKLLRGYNSSELAKGLVECHLPYLSELGNKLVDCTCLKPVGEPYRRCDHRIDLGDLIDNVRAGRNATASDAEWDEDYCYFYTGWKWEFWCPWAGFKQTHRVAKYATWTEVADALNPMPVKV